MPRASRAFPPHAGSASAARQFTREVLASWQAHTLQGDAVLTVSELATNAVLHAKTPFTLALALEVEVLRIAVTDGSAAPLPTRDPLAVESPSGRGLAIVAALSATWGSNSTDANGKTVWCELPVRPRLPLRPPHPAPG